VTTRTGRTTRVGRGFTPRQAGREGPPYGYETGSQDRGGASHPLVELTAARLREFVREPEAIFWTVVFPIVMSLALAVAFPARGTQPVRVGVAEGPQADAVRRTLSAARGIIVRDIGSDEERAIREGNVHLVVVPTAPPTYRFDSARDESRVAKAVVDDALKRAAGRTDPWTAREQPLNVAGSRYVDWLIPGILGMNIMSTGMWGIGFSIVQARLRKLLKRLVASPMRKSEYLLAQVTARLVFLLPEVTVTLAFGVLAFGMPINGSYAAVGTVCVLGALSFAGLGLLTASRAASIEAISGILNLSMLPMWILSGVFFSTSNFPDFLQPFIQALPLTALNDALRAVVLEGATLGAVAPDITLLALWGVVPFALALKLFRWV
jgi:ABC-2 type transport system permease protein